MLDSVGCEKCGGWVGVGVGVSEKCGIHSDLIINRGTPASVQLKLTQSVQSPVALHQTI